jgi:hypothetical protein
VVTLSLGWTKGWISERGELLGCGAAVDLVRRVWMTYGGRGLTVGGAGCVSGQVQM